MREIINKSGILATMVVFAIVACLFGGCANIGSPEGGPRDYTPPVVTKTSPSMNALNFKGNKVEISFDEIVNIKDQQKKVVISPVQHDQPLIRALGKKITIEFRDTMRPETTYVIDFSNAIEDNNEANPLDGYAFTFSTGPEIDSLQVSGIALRASDLEPMQHVLVGLHSNLNDSAFTRLPLERITRTNDLGQFTIKGLKPGKYHVFALNDVDGDYRMARTEDIAFFDNIVEPTASTFTSQDTIFTFDHRIDTVTTGTHTEFLPNNVLLSMFNENYQSLYLVTYNRPSPNKLYIKFGAAVDTMPQLNVIRPSGFEYNNDWYRLERTVRGDSLFYWITDSALIKSDTITVAARYLRMDSTDNIEWYADTLQFGYTKPNWLVKQEQENNKEREQNIKRLEQLREKMAQGKDVDSTEVADLEKALIIPEPKLKIEFGNKSTIEVYDSITVNVNAPIKDIDMRRVKLEMKHDSVYESIKALPFVQSNEFDLMTYKLPMQFEPDSSYRLIIYPDAFTSIYGHTNDSVSINFRVKALEEYANVTIHVNIADHAFVELLDSKDSPVRTSIVTNGTATFNNVLPETYYMRLTIDRNDNGKWDTGNYSQHLQPEEVYYYPKTLKLRKNWDMEQQWNIYETALDLQKPEAIKKNKPEKRKNSLEKDNKKKSSDEDEEDDEFNSTGFGDSSYSGNKYRDYQNTRRNQGGSSNRARQR